MAAESVPDLPQVVGVRTEDSIHEALSKRLDELSKLSTVGPEDDVRLQRRVELGEITPFEADAKKKSSSTVASTGTFNATTGLLDLEKYLKRQAEVAAKRKLSAKNSVNPQKPKKSKSGSKTPENSKKLLENSVSALENSKKSYHGHKKSRQSIFSEKSDKKLSENSAKVPRDSEIPLGKSSWIENTEGDLLVHENNSENPKPSQNSTGVTQIHPLPSESSSPVENSERSFRVRISSLEVPLDSSENSAELLQRNKRSRGRNKRSGNFGSDSESEYSPSESSLSESDSCSSSLRPKKRKKRPIRTTDDGDESHYQSRLSKLPQNSVNPPENSLRTVANLFKVPKSIWKRLYPYQRVSIHWLWELHSRSLGGLMGDEMGLGKTVQVIAFLAGLDCSELLSDGGRFRGLGPSLIVCPATLLDQWVDHFHSWYPVLRVATLHHSGSYHGSPAALLESLKTGGVLLTSYSSFLRNSDVLVPFRWHYVILDEGHKIRNPQAKVTKLLKKLSTPHRLLLTGSPMQNSLKELWSLFDFILPGKLGTLDAFMEHCATPITRGGYANASTLQEATALQVATMLKDAITPYMLRRTKADVQHHLSLPEKNEQVLFCSLTAEQTKLYKDYLISENVKTILHERSGDGRSRARMLVALTSLRKICNHPDLFTYTASDPVVDPDREEDELEDENLVENFGDWRRSGKMAVVRSLLRIWRKQGHRALIFTQGRQMMHVLEALLQREEYKYLRLDGTTPMGERQRSIKLFNFDSSYFAFVATTRVGGLGVNLTGANRVIIYDPDWNPATDAQARERAWRIGQERNVTIYRLISAGTIEEKIYHRQIFKLLLSNRVLDDPRQRRLFQTSDLSELFHLNEPVDGNSTESDRLFKNSVVRKGRKPENSGPVAENGVSAMFEGERVEHLIGRRLGKSENGKKASAVIDDDNYVLNKLFAKTGVNSAMVHDTVLASARLEGQTSTPVHRMALETAQESMDFLRQSRKWCWRPSWESEKK